MSDLMYWRDLKECSDTELTVQRTNLAKFHKLALVRARLMDIQREIDERHATAHRQSPVTVSEQHLTTGD